MGWIILIFLGGAFVLLFDSQVLRASRHTGKLTKQEIDDYKEDQDMRVWR